MKKLLTGLMISFICTQITGCSTNTTKQNNSNFLVNNQKMNIKNDRGFDLYVDTLKKQAQEAGVSSKFLAKQNNILFIDKAVKLDRKQSNRKTTNKSNYISKPNPHGITRYLNRVLTTRKIDKASELWWTYQPQLTKASEKYGVPKEYLMALWGMESSFGYYQGSYDVLSVLATLAFDGRRESLFKQEFINALKILEKKMISREEMKGSWAGAMGQSQFMPTSYLKFAADGNDDGKKDIWTEHYDVFASIANYLSTVGWDKKVPWGIEVKLNSSISLGLSGTQLKKARSFSNWIELGVGIKEANYKKIALLQKEKLWLVLPNKLEGRAFLVSNNYRTLKHWNNSNYFAVSIGQFAERIIENVN